MLDDMRKAFYIAKKDLKEYYLKPPTVSWGIVFPLVFALAFMVRGGTTWLASGMLTIALFFGSTSMSAAAIVFERRTGAFERLFLFPVSTTGIAMGKSLSSFMFGLLSSTVTSIAVWGFLGVVPSSVPLLVLTLSLCSLQMSAMGVLLAFSVKDPSQAMTVFNTIRLPMMFLSGVILPVSRLPEVLVPVSLALPLTYAAESIRFAITGQWDIVPPWISIPVVCGTFFLFLGATAYLIERNKE